IAVLLGVLAVGSFVSALLLSQEQQQTQAQKEQAEANFRKALAAVDQMLIEVGANQLRNEPHMDPVRNRLFERALAFYDGFLEERGADPEVRAETARAYVMAARLRLRLGEPVKAE